MSFKNNVAIFVSTGVLCCCIFTLGQFVLFLSSHAPLKQERYPPFVYIGQFDTLWLQIATDLLLVGLFVFQHSFQNCRIVKEFLASIGLGVYERLLYNFGSCVALQALMQLWHPTPSWVLWEIQTSAHPTAWWVFTAFHCVAWLVIYGGCFIMDLTELLGARQVVYSIQDYPDPLSLKSLGLRRFYSHMRHPGFSALTVLLFVHPLVQMDRLLLAYCFLVYMILCTRVDDIDYNYQRRMLEKKERDLNCSGDSRFSQLFQREPLRERDSVNISN